MKKRIISFILASLMLLGVMPSSLVAYAADGASVLAEALSDATKPSVSIEAVSTYGQNKSYETGGGVAMPDASGNVYFVVKADKKPTENITVSYKTADLSAIAAAGDYVAQSGEIVLTPDEYEKLVVIKTNKAEYALEMEKYSGDAWSAYEYTAPMFEVRLISVTENGVIDGDGDSALCALLAEHTLAGVLESNGDQYLKPYSKYGAYTIYDFFKTPKIDKHDAYIKNQSVNFPSEWMSDYLNSGIDAKVYSAIYDGHVDESAWNSSSKLYINFAGITLTVKGEFHYDEVLGWGPAFIYHQEGIKHAPSSEEEYKDKYKDFFEENFYSVFWTDYTDTDNVISWRDDLQGVRQQIFFEDAFAEDLIIRRNYGSYGSDEGNIRAENYFISMPDSFITKSNIELYVSDNGGYSRRLTGGDLCVRLEDITAPTIEKTNGAYSVYHNFDTVKLGEKLRVAIRFTEPVHVDLDEGTPYFTGKMNGQASYSASARFDYVGGSGTDTLYFEADYTSKYLINSITGITFFNNGGIKDYGGINNCFEGVSDLVISGFTLDMRDPSMSVHADSAKMMEWGKSVSVPVTVGNITSGAVLYYSWTDSNKTPESYDYKTELDNITVNGTQTVTLIGDGDGEKYLHLKAVSKYGNDTINISVTDNATVTKNCLGVYRFDNTPPAVDVESILSFSGDMTKKTYTIPLPADAGSGLAALNMYYVNGEGQEILLGSYGKEDFNDLTSMLEIELLAEDIGLSEGSRRDVTVFFTVTDAVGNIADNVARHTVLFDTNNYIEVESASSAGSFANSSETLDGGNTIIFTGGNASNSGIYYGFDMKIKNIESVKGNVFFSVVKDGEAITEGFQTVLIGSTYRLMFTSPLEAGYYDIQLRCEEEGSVRVSRIYRVYVTRASAESGALGEQIENGTVLINKVYQLPALSSLYYMDASGSIGLVQREYYNNSPMAASFSSFEKAKEYVYFNELRDVFAVTLTAELAEALNNENSNVRRAVGENTVARAGQVWIRYKSSSWTIGSKAESDWVYYYYGTSELLNKDLFSKNLLSALDEVSDRIARSGQTVALTDTSLFYDGSMSSLLDKNGSPYLAPEQIHIKDKVLSAENSNSSFSPEVKYLGDTAIYSSSIFVDVREFVLIGNLLIPEGSRFQYREYGTEEWKDITAGAGVRFRDAIGASGRYSVRELSCAGVGIYNIYIDNESPKISITWNDTDGVTHSQIINESYSSDIRAKQFTITGIDSSELDKYSYVALYTVSNLKLYGVYTVSDFNNSALILPDGTYYAVIADRSGNSYTITLRINSSELSCQIKESKNVRIRLICDRKADQIQVFRVYRNGVLVSGQYASETEYTESGIYDFYVEDIYGNVFSQTYTFNRDYPEVNWRYQSETGLYIPYDPENESTHSEFFKLVKMADGSFKISSSAKLKFQFSEAYGYEFIGTAPDYTESLGADTVVTIGSAQSFQLKVYYKKHPEVYTIYNCSADVTAPTVGVSAEFDVSVPDELEIMKDAIANGIAGAVGDEIIPPRISYSVNGSTIRYISDGETVLSDLIKVNVSDVSGLSLVEVYLNGELLKSQNTKSGFSEMILSRFGEYRIVAVDVLGNTSEFTFKNDNPEGFEYLVNGNEQEIGLHDHENFDSDGNYLKKEYGNSSVSFVIREDMNVFYAITGRDGAKIFTLLSLVDGKVIKMSYRVGADGKPELSSDAELFNASSSEVKKGKEYLIIENSEHFDFRLYASAGNDGEVTLTVYAPEEGDKYLMVEARLSTDDDEFYYVKTELSGECPDIAFEKENGDIVEAAPDGAQIRVNQFFRFNEESMASENIISAEVYYSQLNDLDEESVEGRINIYEDGRLYSAEGFYFIRVINAYGNETVYSIHVSDKFDVTSYTEFADGFKLHYSAEHTEALYSNSKIVFEIHAESATVTVTKNGAAFTPVIVTEAGVTYVTFTENGEYAVSAEDLYGNTVERTAVINSDKSELAEDILYGYNENALRRDEGYTNNKLSVNKELFDSEGFYYFAVQYGDTLTVIYDGLSEKKTEAEAKDFEDVIGAMGDGVYTVIFRNRYGTLSSKVIHYRGTPTLKLERETRNSAYPEIYELSRALEIGFWSNNTLRFSTEAEEYVFTVNGGKTECPKILAFESSESLGRFEYEITYVDEYGFEYSFRAYLVRQELEISAAPGMKGEYVDDVFTTLGDLSVVFSDNAFCTYTLNGSEEMSYAPGQILKKDGTYRFVVTDYAGNVSAITLKKDNLVEFEAVESNTSAVLANGGVANTPKVVINSVNGDSVYIAKAFRNGIAVEDISGNKFTEDGKWELILRDKLGNEAYFCFYIITQQKNGFEYVTPYEYKITEMWYDNGNGVKVSYMQFVDHSDSNSSFNFTENGSYTVLMRSSVTGSISKFTFTVNTTAPDASLVGCNEGETTINDVTLTGCKVGDVIKIYRKTKMGEVLVSQTKITSASTPMPTIDEGGEYRIVVESEAGVQTVLSFTRKHVMNTAGSVFIMIIIGVSVAALFAGLVYRNKSKTDE